MKHGPIQPFENYFISNPEASIAQLYSFNFINTNNPVYMLCILDLKYISPIFFLFNCSCTSDIKPQSNLSGSNIVLWKSCSRQIFDSFLMHACFNVAKSTKNFNHMQISKMAEQHCLMAILSILEVEEASELKAFLTKKINQRGKSHVI